MIPRDSYVRLQGDSARLNGAFGFIKKKAYSPLTKAESLYYTVALNRGGTWIAQEEDIEVLWTPEA